MAKQGLGETLGERRAGGPQFQHLLSDLYFRLEERDRWADHAMKYLLYGNGGGAALTVGLIGSYAKDGGSIGNLWMAIIPFVIGVALVGWAVYYSAYCASKGREKFRELMEAYLVDQETTYTDIFLEMPKFPSKWKYFSQACIGSFASLLAGIAAAVTLIVTAAPTNTAQLVQEAPKVMQAPIPPATSENSIPDAR